MKSFIVASAFVAAVATAKPHGHEHLHHARNNIVTETTWTTEVVWVTEMLDSTTTVWITPGQSAATPTAAAQPNPSRAQFFEPPSAAAPAPAVQTPAAPVNVAPPPPPPAPKPTTLVPVQAPPPPPVAAPVPAPAPAAPAPAPSTPKNSGGSGDKTGDITYYAVGLGACGWDDNGLDNSSNIVALSSKLMGAKSNGNEFCGKTITIYGNGKSTQATVRDKCPSCDPGSIDVSEKVYKELWGDLGSGRQKVTWSFN